MRGEADARGRPLNSALEVDMDFDTTVRGAPAVTVEATAGARLSVSRTHVCC
jgi:U3 small nucleolar ribonucleoprotein component